MSIVGHVNFDADDYSTPEEIERAISSLEDDMRMLRSWRDGLKEKLREKENDA